MKKDIEIPPVTTVFVAAVWEENKEFQTQDWNVYIINNGKSPLEKILIVAKGFDGNLSTSTMRHSLEVLPVKSFAKIEFLQDEVLKLNNEFSVSFFAEGKMLHKKFLFRKNSIRESNCSEIPVMKQKGILAE